MINKLKKYVKKNKPVQIYTRINWEKAAVIFKKERLSPSDNSKSLKAKDLLRLLASVAGIGLIIAFPGAAPAIGALMIGNRSYSRWQTKQLIFRFKKQKYVETEYLEDGKVRVKITSDGMARALTYELDSMEIKKSKKWDKKWRVVIFDIPNKYRRIRDIFRMRLHQLELQQLQESVYVSPYPCFDEIEFLRELYGVSFKVRYLLVEKIEDDSFIRSRFGLD